MKTQSANHCERFRFSFEYFTKNITHLKYKEILLIKKLQEITMSFYVKLISMAINLPKIYMQNLAKSISGAAENG